MCTPITGLSCSQSHYSHTYTHFLECTLPTTRTSCSPHHSIPSMHPSIHASMHMASTRPHHSRFMHSLVLSQVQLCRRHFVGATLHRHDLATTTMTTNGVDTTCACCWCSHARTTCTDRMYVRPTDGSRVPQHLIPDLAQPTIVAGASTMPCDDVPRPRS